MDSLLQEMKQMLIQSVTTDKTMLNLNTLLEIIHLPKNMPLGDGSNPQLLVLMNKLFSELLSIPLKKETIKEIIQTLTELNGQ
jgi:hypothetical protein